MQERVKGLSGVNELLHILMIVGTGVVLNARDRFIQFNEKG